MVHTVHFWINMYIVYTFYVQDTTVYTVQNTNKPKKPKSKQTIFNAIPCIDINSAEKR